MEQSQKQTTYRGVVKFFRPETKWGFITSIEPIDIVQDNPEENQNVENQIIYNNWDQKDVFFHVSSIQSGRETQNISEEYQHSSLTLNKDDVVEFIIRKINGRPQATNIVLTN